MNVEHTHEGEYCHPHCPAWSTIRGDDIVPCSRCGEMKPRATHHFQDDCIRYLKKEIERLRALVGEK